MYNDTTWNVYDTSNSGLAENYITAIAIDSQGNKWFGTADNGVSVLLNSGTGVENVSLQKLLTGLLMPLKTKQLNKINVFIIYYCCELLIAYVAWTLTHLHGVLYTHSFNFMSAFCQPFTIPI